MPGWKAGVEEGSRALSPCCLSRGKGPRVPWGTQVLSQHHRGCFTQARGVRDAELTRGQGLSPQLLLPAVLTPWTSRATFHLPVGKEQRWRVSRGEQSAHLPSEVGSMEAGLEHRILSRRPCLAPGRNL